MNIDIMIYIEPFAFRKCVFGILSGESRHKMAYIAELKIKDPAEKALVEKILRKCNMHNRKYFWQVQPHRNDIPFGRWVEMDIDYILHRNISCLFGKYDIIHYHAIGPCVPLVIAHIFGRKTVATIRSWRHFLCRLYAFIRAAFPMRIYTTAR